jgi:hypothetical protein
MCFKVQPFGKHVQVLVQRKQNQKIQDGYVNLQPLKTMGKEHSNKMKLFNPILNTEVSTFI